MPKLRLLVGEGEGYGRDESTSVAVEVELNRLKDRVVETDILSKETPDPVTIDTAQLNNLDVGDSILTYKGLRPAIYTFKITGPTKMSEEGLEEHEARYTTFLLFGEKDITVQWEDLSIPVAMGQPGGTQEQEIVSETGYTDQGKPGPGETELH